MKHEHKPEIREDEHSHGHSHGHSHNHSRVHKGAERKRLMASSMYTLTAHVTVEPDTNIESIAELRKEIETFLCDEYRINHTALQFESSGPCCDDTHPEGECQMPADHIENAT